MKTFVYKQYSVMYEEKMGKVIVTHGTAQFNFTSFEGYKEFNSIDDVKHYIDEGNWDVGPYRA